MSRIHCNLISFTPGKTGGAEVFMKGLVPLIAANPRIELVVHGTDATCDWIEGLSSAKTERYKKPKTNLGTVLTMRSLAKRRSRDEVVWSPLNQGLGSKSVPEVLTIHDLIPRHYVRNKAKYPGNLKRNVRFWTRWTNTMRAAKKALAVCAVSNAIADQLKRELPFVREVVGIPNGMSRDRFEGCANWSPKQPPTVIAATSGSLPHKGLQTLKAVAAALPEVNFRVIGRSGMKSELANLKLTGWLSDEDYAKEFSTASALFFPSRIEGFGLPVLEALQYGTPVVASDIPVLREVGGPNSIYFKLDDQDDAVKQLSNVILNQSLATKMSAAGKQHAQPFTWERAAGQYVDLFERLSHANK